MKCKRRGKSTNVLLVGAYSTGKTSFISTLAGNEVESLGEITRHSIPVNEVRINIFDTRGYGRKHDISESFAKIDEFVKESYKEYLLEETKIQRDPFFEDQRIHLMVLFLSPTSQGMKDYDLTLLKLMNKKVNTVLVLPKCDYYMKSEIEAQKIKIAELLKANCIDTFGVENNEDAFVFALFSAEKNMVDGASYTARELPCGIARLSNEHGSDYLNFVKLLEHSHEDLLEITHKYFYEQYRTAMLEK